MIIGSAHEVTARFLKAAALADTLGDEGVTTRDLEFLSDEGWRSAAVVAGIRRGRKMHPPSDETRALVADLLAQREGTR